MKKFTVIFVLVFLAVIGLNKYERVAWAENDVEMDIDLFKYVSSDGESYEIEIGGEDVKKVKTATIKIPSGKKMKLKNSFGLDEIGLWASYGSYDEFKERFPEGEYSITLSPKKYGSTKVDMTHDFPPTPEITYPEDGATDVPLNITIRWEPVGNVDDLWVVVKGDNPELGEVELHFNVSATSTSLAIPSGVLLPNTQHELRLTAEISDGRDNDLVSSRVIRFTTGSE